MNNLFVYGDSKAPLERSYAEFTGVSNDVHALILEKKRLIIDRYMAGDIDNLAHLLKRIAGKDRAGSDITLYGLRRALVELLILFPLYRTYVSEVSFSEVDRRILADILHTAQWQNPALYKEFEYIGKFLLPEPNTTWMKNARSDFTSSCGYNSSAVRLWPRAMKTRSFIITIDCCLSMKWEARCADSAFRPMNFMRFAD